MATGPRLFLGFTLVVLAAALTLLWMAFGPRPAPSPQMVAHVPATPAPATQPLADPDEPAVRSVYPGLRPNAARPAPSEPVVAPSLPSSAEPRSAALQPPAPPPVLPEPVPEPAVPDAVAGDAIDLNTASVEQFNALGAGMIGRTIVANRPYASPEELLARRVLNRRDFETIRPRLVAR